MSSNRTRHNHGEQGQRRGKAIAGLRNGDRSHDRLADASDKDGHRRPVQGGDNFQVDRIGHRRGTRMKFRKDHGFPPERADISAEP